MNIDSALFTQLPPMRKRIRKRPKELVFIIQSINAQYILVYEIQKHMNVIWKALNSSIESWMNHSQRRSINGHLKLGSRITNVMLCPLFTNSEGQQRIFLLARSQALTKLVNDNNSVHASLLELTSWFYSWIYISLFVCLSSRSIQYHFLFIPVLKKSFMNSKGFNKIWCEFRIIWHEVGVLLFLSHPS